MDNNERASAKGDYSDTLLEEYKKKRRFDQSPEPLPASEKGQGGRFCWQRHAASRLHYDLRLEWHDSLLSWAVPRGPTLDPLAKRLAVRTEDHPLEYLTWEGTIPKGQYGGGTMMVFDIGYWEPVEGTTPENWLQNGELKFRLWGQKTAGEWTLVATKDDSWLLIKKQDHWCVPGWDPEDFLWSAVSGRSFSEVEQQRTAPAPREGDWPEGARAAPMPLEIKPMLAHIGQPFDSDEWSFELKWDGVRALVYCQQQSLKISSRAGNSYLASFPELQHVRARMKAESFVLDGELVVLDEEGIAHFDRIATRLKVDNLAQVYKLARSQRAVLYVFDLLYLDGRDLRDVCWLERRRLLGETFRPDHWVRLSESLPGSGTQIFSLIVERGLEGVMAKKHSAPYISGRSDCWLKLKSRHLIDCVVVGYTAPRGGRKHLGSLILARYYQGKLVFKGRVGSGLSNSDLKLWAARLKPLITREPPISEDPRAETPITWCEPHHVVEVEYARLSKDGRLFHPTYSRERPDLTPADCGEEEGPARTAAFKKTGEQTIKISNPGKILFPESGNTKLDLADYYQAVAELLLPHLKDRPLSLRRFPDGIHGGDFFQKHPAQGMPDWLREEDRIYCPSTAGLLYLSNLACVEIHSTLSRRPALETPDGIMLDLDPTECDFSKLKEVAWELGVLLDEVEWDGYVKTTGSRGLHVYIPLAPGYTFEQSRLVAGVLGEILQKRMPGLISLERSPSKRARGTVYLDAPQNRKGATTASAYSVRATPTASVSVPLRWEELDTPLGPRDFTINNLSDWLPGRAELWSLEPEPEHRIEDLLPRLESLA
ncbi:MAG: DNA ligase D [Vulcanimicrobiota bacterium]